MNHFKISLIKSMLRIAGCIAGAIFTFIHTPLAIFITASSFGLAEILGILEEVYDKRKEN